MHRAIVFALLLSGGVWAQPVPKHERRAVWIATVGALDWPWTTDPARQQEQLRAMLDRFRAIGINTIFFQVRAECDAFYASPYEPWSYWLTGRQGAAPSPYYDPLAFLIAEAHRRGIQLHAWVNPFRAERRVGAYVLDSAHVVKRRPEWVLTIGSTRMLDPGIPQVRTYVVRVIADIVRRYDVDGVHLDDYFYPYPPNSIRNEDEASFARYNRGHADRATWRRENISLFFVELRDSLRAIKPWLPIGVSPFGIWKNGIPQGVSGLDSYQTLYADPLDWLSRGLVDYLVPQLYWPVGGNPDFALLARWWAEMVGRFGRHLYLGHGLYRLDSGANGNGFPWGPSEFVGQLALGRSLAGVQGSAWFRAGNLIYGRGRDVADWLGSDPYSRPALVPAMPWLDGTPPRAPRNLRVDFPSGRALLLRWEEPEPASDGERARFYAVYRFRGRPPGKSDGLPADGLLGLTGERCWSNTLPPDGEPYYYVVTALDRVGNEGPMSAPVSVRTRTSLLALDDASVPQGAEGNDQLARFIRIAFLLPEPERVQLRVYDRWGRPLRTLVEGFYEAGLHEVRWDGRDKSGHPVPAGLYFYRLQAGSLQQNRPVLFLR